MYVTLEHQSTSATKCAPSKPVTNSKTAQTTSFLDNRPRAVLQRKVMQMSQNVEVSNVLKSSNASFPKVFQFVNRKGKKQRIHSRQKMLVTGKRGHADAARRAARLAKYAISFINPRSRKNLFFATVEHNGKKYTFHLASAGMGGKHPRRKGRSAAHTEQIWRALYSSGVISKYLGIKGKPKVTTIYSRNEACDKNSGNEHGCRSIPISKMGMSPSADFFYSSPYATGRKNKMITLHQMSKLGITELDEDSEDEFLDTNDFRGNEIFGLPENDFEKATRIKKIKRLKSRHRKRRRRKRR